MRKEKPETPSRERSSPQFKRVLVAVDGSDNAERASRVAVDLAARFGSELVVFYAVPKVSHAFVPARTSTLFHEYYSDAKKAALKWIDKVMSLAKDRGVEARPEVRVAVPSVPEEIVGYAARKNIDLIVIGTRGLGHFKKLVVGSVSGEVVLHAHCPVLVVR